MIENDSPIPFPSSETTPQFPVAPAGDAAATVPPAKGAVRFEPIGDYIQLDYEKPAKIGQLFVPEKMKKDIMEFITAGVLACGPNCKQVKPGDTILCGTAALLTISAGGGAAGFVMTLTKEDKILAVVRHEALA